MAKQMLHLKDSSMHDIINFLDQADEHGARISTVINVHVDPSGNDTMDLSTHTVSYEARQLKRIFLRLMAG
eukprot:scaffold336_cov250-Pinguiococcus_pyrenoidosus.AAC.2